MLALPDALANKVGALYSRGEVRDSLDVDVIRQADPYTDEQLLDLAAEHDLGFERQMFASLLARVSELTDADVLEYGVSPAQLAGVRQRLSDWSAQLQAGGQKPEGGAAVSAGREAGRAMPPPAPEAAGHSREPTSDGPSSSDRPRDYRRPESGRDRTRDYRR